MLLMNNKNTKKHLHKIKTFFFNADLFKCRRPVITQLLFNSEAHDEHFLFVFIKLRFS